MRLIHLTTIFIGARASTSEESKFRNQGLPRESISFGVNTFSGNFDDKGYLQGQATMTISDGGERRCITGNYHDGEEVELHVLKFDEHPNVQFRGPRRALMETVTYEQAIQLTPLITIESTNLDGAFVAKEASLKRLLTTAQDRLSANKERPARRIADMAKLKQEIQRLEKDIRPIRLATFANKSNLEASLQRIESEYNPDLEERSIREGQAQVDNLERELATLRQAHRGGPGSKTFGANTFTGKFDGKGYLQGQATMTINDGGERRSISGDYHDGEEVKLHVLKFDEHPDVVFRGPRRTLETVTYEQAMNRPHPLITRDIPEIEEKVAFEEENLERWLADARSQLHSKEARYAQRNKDIAQTEANIRLLEQDIRPAGIPPSMTKSDLEAILHRMKHDVNPSLARDIAEDRAKVATLERQLAELRQSRHRGASRSEASRP